MQLTTLLSMILQLCFQSLSYNYLLFFKMSSLVVGGRHDDDVWVETRLATWVIWVISFLGVISLVSVVCAAVYGCLYTKQKEALRDLSRRNVEMASNHERFQKQLENQQESRAAQDSPPVIYAGDVTVVVPQSTNNIDLYQQETGGSSMFIHAPYQEI